MSEIQSIEEQMQKKSSCFQNRGSTYYDCKNSLPDAYQCIVQPNTTLLDCIMGYNIFLIQAFY